MPETLTIIGIFVVCVVAGAIAVRRIRALASPDLTTELAQLTQRAAWIEHRLELAQRERWDAAMLAALQAERSANAERLEAARAAMRPA